MSNHNCHKKRCLRCEKEAMKWGFQNKKQRWKCLSCGKVFYWERKDTEERNTKKLLVNWLTNYQSLSDVAKRRNIRRITLVRKFKNIWSKFKQNISLETTKETVLILDGLRISNGCDVLVVFDSVSDKPLLWGFTKRENFLSWFAILRKIKMEGVSVRGIISDGQKGLISAVRLVFPGIPHQRCLAHIKRLSLAWLTKSPRTEAGVLLRKIVVPLTKIKTKEEARIWADSYLKWCEKFNDFLKEKSSNPLTGRSWYTHRKLRGVNSLIKNAFPNLFVFLDNPLISSTTNKVEGGINGPLVELLHRHRGTNIFRQKVLVSIYLTKRKESKLPTKNVT